MPNPFVVEQVSDSESLDTIYQLRVSVWQSSAPGVMSSFPDGRWSDDHDRHATHWVIKAEGRIVAAARACIHPSINGLPEAHLYTSCSGQQGPYASFNGWSCIRSISVREPVKCLMQPG